MIRWENKDLMNTLLNVNSYFGEHQSPMAPMLIFFGMAAIPLMGWLFILQMWIPFKWFLIPWALWCGRWALKTFGKEDQKLVQYRQQKADAYKQADDLIHVSHIHKDGLIEYSNGIVGYIITGFPKGFLNDAALSVAFEDFFNELDMWNWDMYLQNVTDELLCKRELPKCGAYTDKQVISDRIDFYSYQDSYSRENTALYRYNFLVLARKNDFKKLRSHLDELVKSDLCKCFSEIDICDRNTLDSVVDRDMCAFINLKNMLVRKYENSEFYGSQALWFDNEIPEQFKKNKETSSINERRVTDDRKR